MHEMFHSLGRWHEHSRPDRDLYVKIQFENVIPGRLMKRSKFIGERVQWINDATLRPKF